MTDTNDKLQGRALDEAVARAMGWQCRDGVTTKAASVGRTHVRFGITRYSTDPATQAEMLAWIDGKTGCGVILTIYTTDLSVAAVLDDYDDMGACTVPPGHGATINEALARLVVAVAGREAER